MRQPPSRSGRESGAPYRGLARAAILIALSGLFLDAIGAGPNAPQTAAKERPVTLETIAGSAVKRVTLSAKAAERIDMKTGEVSEQTIVPTLMVGGIVVDPSAATVAAAVASPPLSEESPANAGKGATEIWIRVPMSRGELSRLAKDKPVRILPLATRSPLAAGLTAAPSGQAPQDVAKSGMTTLFYIVRAENSGLVIGDRVRVELQLEAGTDKKKVVPYAAVYYDATGEAWVYVRKAPLTFVRERITVDRVVGDYALLASGPEIGTNVVTVGAALLYGAEIFGK